MSKFKAKSEDYPSLADFKQACLDRFELVKKELNAILGVDCKIELSNFTPDFHKKTIYLEAWNLSSKGFEYVMDFRDTPVCIEKTFIGSSYLYSVSFDENFNLSVIKLRHTAIGKLANNDCSLSSICLTHFVHSKVSDVLVKHTPDARVGLLLDKFNRTADIISVLDEATSVLNGFKKAAQESKSVLKPLKEWDAILNPQ